VGCATRSRFNRRSLTGPLNAPVCVRQEIRKTSFFWKEKGKTGRSQATSLMRCHSLRNPWVSNLHSANLVSLLTHRTGNHQFARTLHRPLSFFS